MNEPGQKTSRIWPWFAVLLLAGYVGGYFTQNETKVLPDGRRNAYYHKFFNPMLRWAYFPMAWLETQTRGEKVTLWDEANGPADMVRFYPWGKRRQREKVVRSIAWSVGAVAIVAGVLVFRRLRKRRVSSRATSEGHGPRRRMAMLLIREIALMCGGAFVGFVLSTTATHATEREFALAFGTIVGAIFGLTVHYVLPRK